MMYSALGELSLRKRKKCGILCIIDLREAVLIFLLTEKNS